ncbi:helix-turn-helix transcriptional regulator [Pseudoteredinibacter isoporae]|uniref:AraC-like DNA-binding protein n=1 Tax=Pseudoteredinibacter isoporae TaxID=570281 RepID=A0A7X0JWS9_9GAMM|nr:AraC family transcriptional regulator [Pseudoteredinibacter isoporae]MBB6523692.1 AraC-like DNA-binding protein [Pseudoteredinibacter isoporae]NHO89195.1 helix-turn-helix transcriptional regulator [Pseudoteredinibacter isoporae]NIB22194.1 helix-turn-helix transcriptional regulator [Pseudoteredinibacter isoporae]
MNKTISAAKAALAKHNKLPFSLYSAAREQKLLNVPITNPLLILVLSGSKEIDHLVLTPGKFIFLSNTPKLNMRNIPNPGNYFSILIEFQSSDFLDFPRTDNAETHYIQGPVDTPLETLVLQFIEWASLAPEEILHHRRKEILHLLHHSGYKNVGNLAEIDNFSNRVKNIIQSDYSREWAAEDLALKLNMSQSSIRRRLQTENNSIQAIRKQAKLSHGLHLVQTTAYSIGNIAEHCGYQSQSRFTDQFKALFGMTPSELRKSQASIRHSENN